MFQTLISANQLNQQLNDPNWVIIDCRYSLHHPEKGRQDYLESHIPGAYYAHLDEDLSSPHIPGKTGRHPMPDLTKLIELFASWGIKEDAQVIVYDYKSGGIAARLWWLLQYMGHENTAVLNGGWQHWIQSHLPVEKNLPQAKTEAFNPKIKEQKLIKTGNDLLKNKNDNQIIIDSRSQERYQGLNEPIDPVAGHIPGAINAPFMNNVNNEGLFKSKEVLREQFAKTLQGKEAQQAVFYCGSGVTACHNLLALKHAGLGEGKLYLGSWSEWITDPEHSVE